MVDNERKILQVLSTGEDLSKSEIEGKANIPFNKIGAAMIHLQANGLIEARTIIVYRLTKKGVELLEQEQD